MEKLVARYSDWHKLCRAVALLAKFKKFCVAKFKKLPYTDVRSITVRDLKEAQASLIKYAQASYSTEKPELRKLDPFLENGILKVNGRITKVDLDAESTHPIILPSTRSLN